MPHALNLLSVAAIVLAAGCAPALREPPPVSALGGAYAGAASRQSPADVDGLLRHAEAAFAQRPDRTAVESAYSLFLAAARADEGRVEGLIGASRAAAWMIEHETAAPRRATLATECVQTCQWCVRRAPANIECKYRLALALGLQAREHRTTASDSLAKMIPLLEEVSRTDPRLDAAGGQRVLALVLLRAPGWPAGPGDKDAALEHARAADALVSDNADNLMVLGEALAATGDKQAARASYARAESLARARAGAGDPDARETAEAAARALKELGFGS